MVEPAHRARFLADPEAAFEDAGLTEEERDLVRRRDWRGMIHYGVIFFMLEKLGAVVGVSNLHIYAAMRGETLEEFQKTRNAPGALYSVAGTDARASPGIARSRDERRLVQPPVEQLRVAFVGYGEVGGILARALASRGVARVPRTTSGCDARSAYRSARRAERDGVCAGARRRPTAVADARSRRFGGHGEQHPRRPAEASRWRSSPARSCSTSTRRRRATKAACGARIAAAGGRYVESAVMTSVPPYGIKVPMLLGGPHAAALAPLLGDAGLRGEGRRAMLGVASAIKMCRSVIVKGMEALVIESFVTARRYGVEDEVLASLAETFPGLDWETQRRLFLQPRRRSMASAAPRKCAKRRPPSAKPASSRSWPARSPIASSGWRTSRRPRVRADGEGRRWFDVADRIRRRGSRDRRGQGDDERRSR